MDRHQGPMQAVIKEAASRDQKDPSSWAKISPDEAEAIRGSYRESEKEIERLRGILFKCGSFIADRYQEGDAEYQIVILVNEALIAPTLSNTAPNTPEKYFYGGEDNHELRRSGFDD